MVFIVFPNKSVKAIAENVNVGDTATQIVVVSPFSGIQTVSLRYKLPTGEEMEPAFATYSEGYPMGDGYDGHIYVMSIPPPLTESPGTVEVAIVFTDTSAQQFVSNTVTVEVGGIESLPFPDSDEQGASFGAVLEALLAEARTFINAYNNGAYDVESAQEAAREAIAAAEEAERYAETAHQAASGIGTAVDDARQAAAAAVQAAQGVDQYADSAASSASNAAQSASEAAQSASDAASSISGMESYAAAAAQSASNAAKYSSNASQSAADASSFASQAQQYASAAVGSATQASQHAASAEGYAQSANQSAAAASAAASTAAGSASTATSAASSASSSSSDALDAATAASEYASSASSAASRAASSADEAGTYATSAGGFASSASSYATAANNSRNAAASSASSAQASATAAQTAAANAQNSVDEFLETKFPIGLIFMFNNNINPAQVYGGTWERVLYDRAPIGAGDTYSVGETAGAEVHRHTSSGTLFSALSYSTSNGGIMYNERVLTNDEYTAFPGVLTRKSRINIANAYSSVNLQSNYVNPVYGYTSYESNYMPVQAVNFWARIA